MKFKKTRIAFSLFCGILRLLLIVLWIRSFWIVTWIEGPLPFNGYLELAAVPGAAGIVLDRTSTIRPWRVSSISSSKYWDADRHYSSAFLGYFDLRWRNGFLVVAPDWFLVGIATAVAAVPRVRFHFRFSLRTLLIATTAVAIGLWFVVWMSQK